MQWIGGAATALGLGFVYFISAIPAAVALGLSVWVAALLAWLGYSAGGLVVVLLGDPLRRRLMGRFRIEEKLGSGSLLMQSWERFGLPVFGLLAPVTIGPQAGALLGLALGTPVRPLLFALSLGALPWAAGFAITVQLGLKVLER